VTDRDTARNVVLDRIRAAIAVSPPPSVVIPRDYEREPLRGSGNLTRFTGTVADYGAQVIQIEPAEIGATVASLVPAGQVVIPADLPPAWVDGVDAVDAVPDDPGDPLPIERLERAAAVATGCALGIAATGTIVLDAGEAQGRRALTLIPDHHICVIFADQIVDTVPQAFAALNPAHPLTFISGPSATSDIELERVEGVHGPRTLDVLVVAATHPQTAPIRPT